MWYLYIRATNLHNQPHHCCHHSRPQNHTGSEVECTCRFHRWIYQCNLQQKLFLDCGSSFGVETWIHVFVVKHSMHVMDVDTAVISVYCFKFIFSMPSILAILLVALLDAWGNNTILESLGAEPNHHSIWSGSIAFWKQERVCSIYCILTRHWDLHSLQSYHRRSDLQCIVHLSIETLLDHILEQVEHLKRTWQVSSTNKYDKVW